MSYGVLFRVWGEFALFTRPEMKAERVSYYVPPPAALRGIAEAIHLPGVDRPQPDANEKPPIRWEIRKVAVLKPLPVQLLSVRRDELGKIGPCDIQDERQQRASLLLRDVDYVVHAALAAPPGGGELPAGAVAKHLEIFKRRLKRGEQHFQPCLGCREFPAHCEFAPQPWETYKRMAAEANPGRRKLGSMPREMFYRRIVGKDDKVVGWEADPERREWFNAEMNNGVTVFPRAAEGDGR